MSDTDEQYVLLPPRGLKATRGLEFEFLSRFQSARSTLPALELSLGDFLAPVAGILASIEPARAARPSPLDHVQIIDSVRENGPKLVRMGADVVAQLARVGLRAAPLRYYKPAQSPSASPTSAPPGAAQAPRLTLTITGGPGGPGIAGVKVVALTRRDAGEGAAGVTNAAGQVSLALGGASLALESLYVAAPAAGYWGLYREGPHIANGDTLALPAIAPPWTDGVRRCYAPAAAADGAGVKVAVIDTGVGPHPDVNLAGGVNAVQGEARGDYGDNGLGHGTHVAGIIGGQGADGPTGVAPGVSLWSARVYPGNSGDRATNYSIMKAMILATSADCDLLNLSLSSADQDPVLQDAVSDAADQGAVVMAATGNQGLASVGYPARYRDAIGVSAFGTLATYPDDTPPLCEIGSPRNGPDFFAAFSNWGSEVRFIAPGVGIVSAALGGGYAVRSGTSMACAAATGMAARLLSANPDLLAQTRDRQRSAAIQNMLQDKAVGMGFSFKHQGAGRL